MQTQQDGQITENASLVQSLKVNYDELQDLLRSDLSYRIL